MYQRWQKVVWVGFGDQLFGRIKGRVVKHDFTDNTYLVCWQVHLVTYEGVPRRWKYHSSWVYNNAILAGDTQ